MEHKSRMLQVEQDDNPRRNLNFILILQFPLNLEYQWKFSRYNVIHAIVFRW